MLDCITVDSEEITVDSGLITVDDACCPPVGSLVEAEINKVATQYREATKFLGLARAILAEAERAAITACGMPAYFNLDTALGDQLTIIGKWLGFPRCHCVCNVAPVIGYDCDGTYAGPYDLAGYCEPGSSFIDCPPLGNSTLCIDDDETYRGILKARRYQILGLFDIASLQEAIRHVWGNTAQVSDATIGEVVVTPGRALYADEIAQLPIVFRALPIAPGIRGLVHLGIGPVMGYGAGWAGHCENAGYLCPVDPHAYTCA